MLTRFQPLKVIQAAAVLLRSTEAHRMSRLRLLKLLYIADRECIQEAGRPITGDSAAALDHGPVLSQTYNCIKGADYASHEWNRYFRNSGQDVVSKHDPGNGELSRYEIEKLQAVASRFAEWNDWAIAEHTHTFGEWLKNRPNAGSSRPIHVRDLLEALGFSDADAMELIAEARAYNRFDKALASVECP